MRPGRLPTVGRAAGEPPPCCPPAYGCEAGAAGHLGGVPCGPQPRQGTHWGPRVDAASGRGVGSAPGARSQPQSSGPRSPGGFGNAIYPTGRLAGLHNVTLCEGSCCHRALSPSGTEVAGEMVAMWSPASAEPLSGVRGVPLAVGGASHASLGHLTAAATTARDTDTPGMSVCPVNDTAPGFAAGGGPGGSRWP